MKGRYGMDERKESQFTKMSLTDYAKTRGVTLQSISQTFKRHSGELEGMYVRQGRRTVLTEGGVQLLDRIREKEHLPASVTAPETLTALKDRVTALEEELKQKTERVRELEQIVSKKEDQLNEKQRIIDEKEARIDEKEKLITVKNQQLLLATKKKGVFQRMREFFMGEDEVPLPGAEKDEIIDG